MHVCRDASVVCVRAGRSSSRTSLREAGRPLCLLWLLFLSIHPVLPAFPLRPRKGKWESKENTISLLLVSVHCFRTAGRERGAPAQPSTWGALWFSILAGARFFTEGNYQRGPAFMDEAWWKVIENDYFLF